MEKDHSSAPLTIEKIRPHCMNDLWLLARSILLPSMTYERASFGVGSPEESVLH